ncbi:Rer1 family-like protein [Leishmania tarentolae]|uniref:Protein RER1 n=1 Tax=Leishmania tarentolae TaxID=5689 RepID=A0A640KHL6_LEITA|nr:Rer1 family-like protein [Leishmania tarentolae]
MQPSSDFLGPTAGNSFLRKARATYKRYLDASVPHRGLRWCFFAFLAILYVARVVTFGGFYVITYGLCIHLLYLLLLLITPLSDPDEREDTPLPTTQMESDEYRPFMPKVQEFVVWKQMFTVLLVCLFLTMFSFLDIPVFWPILVLYFLLLFATQVGGRVRHMIKHGYVPWNAGKPKFVPKSTL